jgi:sugar lactone lactonase YvrE
MDKKMFRSKALVGSLIFSFIFLIVNEAYPKKITSPDADNDFKPIVRTRAANGQEIPEGAQKDRFKQVFEEGKKLFQEEMNYEAAIKKFKEAKDFATTQKEKADVYFYLSLAYYITQEQRGPEEFDQMVRKLIEVDYYRELDPLVCPPKYVELYQGIKKGFGILKIRSNPLGADVYINESQEAVGKTPITVGAPAGDVKIKLKMRNKEKQGMIKVTAGIETKVPVYSMKGSAGTIIVLGGLLVAGGIAAALLLKGKGGKESTPPPAQYGSIQVNSSPTGAKVYLDGSDTGKTTNTTLSNVSAGNHTVKLVKEGYVDYEENISVTAGQTANLIATLSKHKITVTSPKSGTSWIKGEKAEIKWNISTAADNQAAREDGKGFNLALNLEARLFARSQSRGLQPRLSFKEWKSSRRDSRETIPFQESSIVGDESFESQSASGDSHPVGRNNYIPFPLRPYPRDVRKDSGFDRIHPNPVSGFSPQTIKPLEKADVLTISYVKILLYSGKDVVRTIVENTSNTGSYQWTVDSNLEEGSDFKVRVVCSTEQSIYGESRQFSITGGYKYVTQWGKQGAGNNELSEPFGIATDSSGKIYVADSLNHRIVKFTSDGTFITKWGSFGASDDNYRLHTPHDVAVDSSGNVFVADSYHNRIMKFTSDGTFIMKWGGWGVGNSQFINPKGIAVDNAGNVFVADTDNHRIMKFTSKGKFITKWGSPGTGNYKFNWPSGIAVDSSGNVYVTDCGNHRIVKFTANGDFLSKWGSQGNGDNQFNWPLDATVDKSDNIYVADQGNHRIVKFTSDGKFITKWGSLGIGNNQFQDPSGVAADLSGNIYVADRHNNRIVKFTSAGSYITKWGTQSRGNYEFSQPHGIAIDSAGKVYVADTYNYRIMKFTSNGSFITKWSSIADKNYKVSYPSGVAVDRMNNVYVADECCHRILKFTSDGKLLKKWGSWGNGDYNFNSPSGIAIDNSGHVYIADTNNHRIMKFNTDGKFITKWGSEGNGNYQFQWPRAVAVDNSGHVYIADNNNNRIMKFTSSGIYIAQWGSLGWGDNKFQYPQGIAVDNLGYVYVADTWNHLIKKFSSKGIFITSWGSWGNGDYQFTGPMGLTVDFSGNVYVADTFNHRIMKFRPISGTTQAYEMIPLNLDNPSIENENSDKRFDLFKRLPSATTKENRSKH